jgi:hypothetical protein
MKPEAQRIAIAEACGLLPDTYRWEDKSGDCCIGNRKGERGTYVYDLPNYLNDLNAMHQAEELITDWPKYTKMLAKVIAGVPDATRAEGTIVKVCTSVMIRATAAQRAEAFLRTLGLWTN